MGFDGPIPGSQFANNVVIGYAAGQALSAGQNKVSQNNVIIGAGAGNGGAAAAQENIMIGAGTTFADGVNKTVSIGNAHVGINASEQVLLGSDIVPGNGGARSVIIGTHAASTELLGADRLLIEIIDSGLVKRSLIAGNFVQGNVVLGNASAAQRNGIDAGTNLLMLVAGTKAGSNPITGGYFYYKAADGLHFVGAAGTDTIIAPP